MMMMMMMMMIEQEVRFPTLSLIFLATMLTASKPATVRSRLFGSSTPWMRWSGCFSFRSASVARPPQSATGSSARARPRGEFFIGPCLPPLRCRGE